MHSSNLLVSPPGSGLDDRRQDQKDLWAASAGRIDRMLPGFLAEAIPSPSGEEGGSTA